MLDYLKRKFYQWVPQHQQQILKTALLCVWHRLCLSVPIYRIEKNDLTVTFIGRSARDPYFIFLLYGEYLTPQKIGVTAVWHINKAIELWEGKSDIVLYRDAGFQPAASIEQRMFEIPYYVTQAAHLPPVDTDLLSAFRDPSTVSDLNKIQKSGFSYYISDDPAQLEHFYHWMYKPFILSRHRDSARIPSWPAFKRIHEAMELLLVTKNDEVVAGALNLQVEDDYTGYANGVLNADPRLLKEGVVSAIYWFGMVEGHRRNCKTVNLGTSRPFLKNGVLAYKKKWGSQVVIDRNEPEFRLLAGGNQLVAQRCLQAIPFMCKQGNQLISLVFLGEQVALNDKDLSSYLRACLFQGDGLSTWIVLLNADWVARSDVIQTAVRGSRSARIIDLSKGTLLDLSTLISSLKKASKTSPASINLERCLL